jgi:hypothetical protein
MIWFLAPSSVSKLDRRHTGRLRKINIMTLRTGEGWVCGAGAESYDRKKAWFSIKHSIVSVLRPYINFLPFVIPTIWLYPYRYVQSIKYHLTRRTVPVSNCVNTNFDPSRFFNYLSSFLKKVNFFKIQNQPYCVVFLLPLLYFVLWRL